GICLAPSQSPEIDVVQLRSQPEISDLRIECALEGWSRSAALDIGGEALVACHDVCVIQDAQHCRHHQIAGSETIAIQVRSFPERLGKRRQALLRECDSSGAA